MFKQGKGANIHVAIKIYAIADLLQGEIAILMQHEKTEAWCFLQSFGRISAGFYVGFLDVSY